MTGTTTGQANSSSNFGPDLRPTAYDTIFIQGKAKQLSIIEVPETSVKIMTTIFHRKLAFL